MKKKFVRAVSAFMGLTMMFTAVPMLTGCGGGGKKDSIVIMTEELSGLFNPFYATSGADMEVVGLTQIGMLTTKYKEKINPVTGEDEGEAETVAGKDYETVALDYEIDKADDNSQTVYRFVIKNDLKFSDGEPLTMNDVLFNMYEYLDPVYTGSSTMYSIKIKGLKDYRTQKKLSGSGVKEEEIINSDAASRAKERINFLKMIYKEKAVLSGSGNSYSATETQMRSYINNWEEEIPSGYIEAVANKEEQKTLKTEDYKAKVLADYELTLKTFKEELQSDFKAAKESYDVTTDKYKPWAKELSSDIFKFFLYEGYITPEYLDVEGKKDRNHIVKFNNTEIASNYTTEEAAIERVYSDKIKANLLEVLTYYGTYGTLTTLYTAAAKDIILHNNMGEGGIPNISGIRSLGHTEDAPASVTFGTGSNMRTYKVAKEHDAKGKPVNNDEYDVLEITIEGVDPKAIYNFSFSVAPSHIYTNEEIDIKNNKFGVKFADSKFQSDVIQSQRNVEVPVGAGAFMATDENNSDNPTGSAFWKSNVVYYKANENFMFEVKAKKLRLQVVSSTNAIDKLRSGEVDYITPQFTKANSEELRSMESQGFTTLDAWQLGYGYVGINAGKVPNIYTRRAIMAAMDAKLAKSYYEAGTCEIIEWPMSKVSWAYPKNEANGHEYTQWTDDDANETKDSMEDRYPDALTKIRELMKKEPKNVSHDITFTIAGSSISEHPTYTVFRKAATILNYLGWNVEVKADSQALTKLSTGSLEVWAAAWGSTIDPDMYQVYHKNSTATSVYAWGYREIKADTVTYRTEMNIINQLSELIDKGRETLERDDSATADGRKTIYKKAMGLVLDLAVEMPIYQRKTLYAYNSKTIKGLTEKVNPYSSPLEKIWELEIVK